MIICHYCDGNTTDDSRRCPHCGAWLTFNEDVQLNYNFKHRGFLGTKFQILQLSELNIWALKNKIGSSDEIQSNLDKKWYKALDFIESSIEYQLDMAQDIRMSIKQSYFDYFKRFFASQGDSKKAHEEGLYNTLHLRWVHRIMMQGVVISSEEHDAIKQSVALDVLPFTLMNENNSVRALAEYVLYQEAPNLSNKHYLKKQLSLIIHNAPSIDGHKMDRIIDGFKKHSPWSELLNSDMQSLLLSKSNSEMNTV